MTQQRTETEQSTDGPDGSIFLSNPSSLTIQRRELEALRFALLTGRGIARELEPDQITDIDSWLEDYGKSLGERALALEG